MTDTPDHSTPSPAGPADSPVDPHDPGAAPAVPHSYPPAAAQEQAHAGSPQTEPPPAGGFPPPVGFTPPPFPGSGQPRRNDHWTQRYLVRSREERMIAGVAGGVARRLGVDPLIVRILLVILAFFGGVGVLLYGLGWLLLPDDDGRRRSLLEDTTSGRSATRTRNLLLVAALVTAIVISGVWVLSGQVIPVVLLALAVTALYLYARRDDFQPAWPGPYAGAPTGADSSAGGPTQYAGSYGPGTSNDPRAPYNPGTPYAGGPTTTNPAYFAAAPGTAQYPPAAEAAGSWLPAGGSHALVPPSGYAPTGYPPGPPGGPMAGSPIPAPKQPRVWRERSYLGLLTISVGLVALGVLAAVDAGGATVPGTGYVGVALGVVALGLLVGAWIGRSRGLILLGFLLCVAMIPAAVADTATDGDWSRIGDWSNAETVREAPSTATGIRPTYDVDSGRLVLDLRNIDFTSTDISTSLSIGAGEINVLVPPNVDVTASGMIDIGQVILFGSKSSGVDVAAQRTDLGADGAGGGQLKLMIDANVGNVEVRREAA